MPTLADVVIDKAAPVGDAAVELARGIAIGAVSSLMGVLIAQLLTERVCRRLLAAGRPVAVHMSANLEAGDDHNAELHRAYRARVRPIEP